MAAKSFGGVHVSMGASISAQKYGVVHGKVQMPIFLNLIVPYEVRSGDAGIHKRAFLQFHRRFHASITL